MFYTTGTKADWHSLDARYFVIKSNNMDNVEISMEKVRIRESNFNYINLINLIYLCRLSLQISLDDCYQ